MSSSGMWHCVGLVLTDLSEDYSTLRMEAKRSSKTSVNTRPTQRHIPEYDIFNIKQSWKVQRISLFIYSIKKINE
jgi:hypothetical protein